MVMDFGMSRLGKVNFRESRRAAFLAAGEDFPRERTHSEQTSRQIDEEIARIFDESLGPGSQYPSDPAQGAGGAGRTADREGSDRHR